MKLSPALIVAIVAAFVTGVLGPLAVTFYQGQQKEAKEERRLSAGVFDTETLLGHSVFTHADTWVDLIIPQTQVSDEARLFLTIKFTAFHDALEDMVKNTNFDSLNNEQFHAVTSKNLNDTVVSYIADARRQGISDEFIADFIISHQQVVDILVDSIEDNV